VKRGNNTYHAIPTNNVERTLKTIEEKLKRRREVNKNRHQKTYKKSGRSWRSMKKE